MRNMDAIGSIYFDFNHQKTFGFWVATNYDERLKSSCEFSVTELISAPDYTKPIIIAADNKVIEKIREHWMISEA